MAACQSSREAIASQPARVDTLVLVLEYAKDPQVGSLKLTDTPEGVRWTMTDTARRGKSYGELRSGVIAGVCVQDFADDFVEVWTRKAASAATEYKATLRRISGDQIIAEQCVNADEWQEMSDAIPNSERFTALWRSATGIAKMFWYRNLGPIDRTHGSYAVERSMLPPGSGELDCWRISGAFSDGLEIDNTDFDESPAEGPRPIGVP